MNNLIDNPFIVFALALFVLWLSTRIGSSFLKRRLNLEEGVREDFSIILTATLTLLVLIIGFSFLMGINRYDQRKDYEEAEANAIGTEYVRADLLPAADAARVRALLRNYLDDRILFYGLAMSNSFGRSMPIRLDCRASCGPRSRPRPQRSRHASSP